MLEPLKISPLAELDGTCNTILPAEEQYTVPFAPRPPGPSGGRLAFDGTPGTTRAPPPPLAGPQDFVLYYDFDMPVGGRHAGVLGRIYDYASSLRNPKIGITCQRGATLLSGGTLLAEREDLPQLRAQEIVKLLRGAGLEADTRVESIAALAPANGDADWRQRSCMVRVTP